MKLMIILMITLTLSLAVQAKEIIVNRSHLEERLWSVNLDMPCDWNRDLSSTTVYGYYGEERSQNMLEPTRIEVTGRAKNYLEIDLSPDVATFNGMPLTHIAIDYPETKRHCKTTSNPYESMTK